MRKTVVCILGILLFVTGCKEERAENISAPEYFFSWNAETNQGRCLNAQGVEGYNPKFVGPCGDLRGYNFEGLSLLNGVDLRGAILDGVNLSGFSLNGANLTAVKARGASFNGSEMNGAKLSYGHFEGSTFKNVEINGAYLQNAFFSGAIFNKSKLYGVDFSFSDIGGSSFNGDLNTVNFKGSLISYGTVLPFDEEVAKDRGLLLGNSYRLDLVNVEKPIELGDGDRSPASE